MKTELKTVTLNYRLAVELLQMIHVMQSVAAAQQDKDESSFLQQLTDKVLTNIDSTGADCLLKLTNQDCFACYLVVDKYLQFLTDTGCSDTEIQKYTAMQRAFQK